MTETVAVPDYSVPDYSLTRQRSQESLQRRLAHFGRVALTVENNVAFDPADISLLGAKTVMFQAKTITHLIKQLGGAWWFFLALLAYLTGWVLLDRPLI